MSSWVFVWRLNQPLGVIYVMFCQTNRWKYFHFISFPCIKSSKLFLTKKVIIYINVKLPFDTKGHLAQLSINLGKLKLKLPHHRPNQPRAIIIRCLSPTPRVGSGKPDNVLCNAMKWARFWVSLLWVFRGLEPSEELHFALTCIFWLVGFFSSELKVKIY